MGKRAKALIIASACVILLGGGTLIAGPIIYRQFFIAPAAEAPSLSADDSALAPTSGEALDAEAMQGDWSVGEGSYAGYRVDEVLNGSPATVTGRSDTVSGTLTIEEQSLTKAEFAVDVASIETDSSQRDAYFRDRIADVSAHPTASFSLTEPLALALDEPGAGTGQVAEQTLSGELTLAGVTRPVAFNVQFRAFAAEGSADATATAIAEVAGQIPITFADYGMTAPNLGFVSVEPTGFVEFSLVLHPADH